MRGGDLVGVCAPAGPVDHARLDRGVAELESLGYRVRVTPRARQRRGFTAGTIEERLADLRGLVEDPEVAAVVCARGGAGAFGLLDRLPVDLVRAHPKALVGYSDITFLHLLWARAGLISFHGPMIAWEFAGGAYHRESLLTALRAEGRPYQSESDDLLVLREGQAEGRLRGGCLPILAAAVGTPWALQTGGEDTILFVEDVDEPPYRVDRWLRQLRYAGALADVRGIVFGDMKGCSPGIEADYGLEQVILEALAGLEVPVALGLSSGHTRNPGITLPLGVRARVRCTAEEGSFQMLEAAVS